MATIIEPTTHKGWAHCWRISNGDIELIVTADVGPRVIRCGVPGGRTFFKTFDDQAGRGGEPEWKSRGGSRIWIAPEDPVASCAPENSPVSIDVDGDVLAPTNPLVLWAFTDLSVPRWSLLRKYVVLRQDPQATSPQTLGHVNSETWGAYLLDGDAFVTRCTADWSARYPDFGCSFETFTNRDMLELETLGPLCRVAPKQWLEHTDHWALHRDVSPAEWTDEELDRVVCPLLKN